jgi:hypothetical protein
MKNKEEQKQHLIDMMKGDEELGLYDESREIKVEDIFNDEKRKNIKKFIDEIENPSEPNQALKDATQRYEKYSERFDNDESAIGNPETWGKRVLTEEDIFNQRDIDAVTDYINKETSKQETLEEAGDRELSYINDVFSNNIDFVSGFRIGMLLGAKWQQERSYSEEDLKEAFSMGRLNKSIKDFNQRFKNK